MAELARLGAAAFTDDGHPVVSAGLMQRALQYSAVTGRLLALHEEEPTLSRDGQMHDGAVSAELGLAGWPSVAESVMIGRDCDLAAYEQRPLHIMHLSARESVAAVRAAQARGVAVSAEVSPHHLCLTDDTVRTLDTNRKMNPPLRSEDDRQALLEGAPRRHDRLHRDRSRAARAAREGRAVRGGAVRRHRPRDGVRGDLHAPRRAGRARPRPRARADVRRARRGSSGCRCRGSRWGSRPTSSCSTSTRPGRVTEDGFALEVGQLVAARRDADAARSSRRSPTEGWCTRHEQRLPRPRGRHRLPGPLGRRRRRRVRRGRLHDRR